jgi:hypothetical protein
VPFGGGIGHAMAARRRDGSRLGDHAKGTALVRLNDPCEGRNNRDDGLELKPSPLDDP